MEHMNGLALYAGYGGLDLGVLIAEPRYKTVCYVEREASCAAGLVARMEAQELHQAPVWDDSATFDGYPWRGKVDILTAGFPCPGNSTAGKRKGVFDERWLWPDVARIAGEVEPEKLLLENVPGLASVNDGYAMRIIFGDLAQMRYDAVWASVPASSVGARQKRDRIFIVARARCEDGKGRGQFKPQGAGSGGPGPAGTSLIVGNAHNFLYPRRVESEKDIGPPNSSSGKYQEQGETPHWKRLWVESGYASFPVGSANSQRRREARQCQRNGVDWYGGGLPTAPPGPDSEQLWFELLRDIETTPQPAVCGVADGNSKRMDRLRMLGNGVYPLAAAYAWRVGNAVLATQFGGE